MDAKIGFDPAENEPPKECCVVALPGAESLGLPRPALHPAVLAGLAVDGGAAEARRDDPGVAAVADLCARG